MAAIERAALEAWPAAEVHELDGWRLRAMAGVTRRANSAWTAETGCLLDLDARIAQVEAFYVARGQASIVHLSPCSPSQLDSELERRGYAVDAPVSVQTADLSSLVSEPENTVRVERECFDAWWELSAMRGRYADAQAPYRGLLQRLGEGALYALATIGGEPAAVGLGVVHGEWVGVFGMHTLEHHRRRGLGTSVLHALARAALDDGAIHAYLQVERDNAAAQALYQRLGFAEHHGTHYRVRRA
jgi:ribosomal protein S18 acetylase RimI-like enzyme